MQAAVVELPSLTAIADPTGKLAGGADAAGVDGLSLVSPDEECAVASLPLHPSTVDATRYLPPLPPRCAICLTGLLGVEPVKRRGQV